jgi:small subunit ribosomal protein S25e
MDLEKILCMGGNKKKPAASSDKTSNAGKASETKNVKKEETKKNVKSQQKISVVIDDAQGKKALQGMKAITPQALARAAGIKVSVANNFIKQLELKGIIRAKGGYSGHRVYQMLGA